jgi:type II secretory pathway component HofQ
MLRIGVLGLTSLLCAATVPVIAQDTKESPAEAIKKTLDQTVSVDYTCQSLQEAVQHLRDKTKLNLVLDLITLQSMGLLIDDGNPNPPQIHLKLDKGKARQALQRALQPYNLTYVILGDSVLITTEEMGLHRQMRQRINANVDNVPLEAALQNLAKTHAISLVIDPKCVKQAQTEKVSLQLDDATLETTVRLLAEMASLKAVRFGNVLFVTDERKAEKLRLEEPSVPLDPRFPRIGPGVGLGIGGFGVPPSGVPPINVPPLAPPPAGAAPGRPQVAPAAPPPPPNR